MLKDAEDFPRERGGGEEGAVAGCLFIKTS